MYFGDLSPYLYEARDFFSMIGMVSKFRLEPCGKNVCTAIYHPLTLKITNANFNLVLELLMPFKYFHETETFIQDFCFQYTYEVEHSKLMTYFTCYCVSVSFANSKHYTFSNGVNYLLLHSNFCIRVFLLQTKDPKKKKCMVLTKWTSDRP